MNQYVNHTKSDEIKKMYEKRDEEFSNYLEHFTRAKITISDAEQSRMQMAFNAGWEAHQQNWQSAEISHYRELQEGLANEIRT